MRALCMLIYAILQFSEGSCFVSRYSKSAAQTALSATYSNTDSKADYANQIVECNNILYRAASTRNEDPELVLSALEKLEKLYREKRKTEGETVAKQVLFNLNGDWRLVFTTGTKSTQDRFQTKINYVPFKAIQSFNSTQQPFVIENGIYAWDVPVIKFSGGFDFDLRKSKVCATASNELFPNINTFDKLLYPDVNMESSLNSTLIKYLFSEQQFS